MKSPCFLAGVVWFCQFSPASLLSQNRFYDSKIHPAAARTIKRRAARGDTMANKMTIRVHSCGAGKLRRRWWLIWSRHGRVCFVATCARNAVAASHSIAPLDGFSDFFFFFFLPHNGTRNLCQGADNEEEALREKKMISSDIIHHRKPWHSLYPWLFNLVANPHWSMMQKSSLRWKMKGFFFFLPNHSTTLLLIWISAGWKINISGGTWS